MKANLCYTPMASSSKKHKKPATATEVTLASKAKANGACIVYQRAKMHYVQPKQPNSQLYSIPEDNSYDNDNNEGTSFLPLFPSNKDSVNPNGVKGFFSALSKSEPGGGPADADSFVPEVDEEPESEDFINDIDNVSQDPESGSESEGSVNIFLLAHLPTWQSVNKKPATKPVVMRGPTHKSKCQSTLSQINSKRNSKSGSYNPTTCVFSILCFILQHNRTNSPFEISSNNSYDDLCLHIAEKLGGGQSGLLQLQYQLYSNSKQAVTSVQSDEELALFKACLCSMLVPPLLSSGQPSCSHSKNISVYYKDKMIVDEIDDVSNSKDCKNLC
ncbi:hypothetical protein J3R82DRAFT_6663 [Butyriboletus roseoflavus]|nr:hypothetical protein J3R82DRAFT_6663 [Butyriboletus roseoflavus]